MLATTAARRLFLNAYSRNLFSSQLCRSVHQSIPSRSDIQMNEVPLSVGKLKEETNLSTRFNRTAEVIVSKIFPAGFGWQSASVVADKMSMEADTLGFALTTGFGDALGVFVGHTAYFAAKKRLSDSNINMVQQAQVGFLLSSAAMCSGTVWQPIVNVLQGIDLSFNAVFMGTWFGCGTAFYAGLRAGRTFLSSLEYIEEPTYKNSKDDASLSVAIGGATGFFVGTDAAYLPDQNFLLSIVGIADETPALLGSTIAGTSTALGFATTQSFFNVAYPAGKCWVD